MYKVANLHTKPVCSVFLNDVYTWRRNPLVLVTCCITHLLLCNKPLQNRMAQNKNYLQQLTVLGLAGHFCVSPGLFMRLHSAGGSAGAVLSWDG